MTEQPALTPDMASERLAWLLERRRLEQARALLGEVMAQHPQHPRLLFLGALLDLLEDRHDEALASVHELLAKDPHDYETRRLEFHILEDSKQYAAAERVLLGLLADHPQDAASLADYSILMLKTDHVHKASRLAAEAVRLAPESEMALLAATLTTLILEPGPAAREQLRELMQHHPQADTTAMALVLALNDRGHYDQALEIARQILLANPSSTVALDLIIELRVVTHWSMLPLRPLARFGWAGSAVMWFVFVGIAYGVPKLTGASNMGWGIGGVMLGFIVYSWVWPPILRRWLRRGL